jgi:hypothetical protein
MDESLARAIAKAVRPILVTPFLYCINVSALHIEINSALSRHWVEVL